MLVAQNARNNAVEQLRTQLSLDIFLAPGLQQFAATLGFITFVTNLGKRAS